MMKLNEKSKAVLTCLFVSGAYLIAFYYTSSFNHRQSLERQQFCYQQIAEVNLPITICSQIALAADGARNAVNPHFFPAFMSLLGICILLLLRIIKLQTELREIKRKLDV